MLKRLFAALRSKPADRAPGDGAPDANKATDDTDPAVAASAPPDEELITVHDAEGNALQISLGEWRDKVFLPNLRLAWDDADELYRQIITGVNDGFAAELPAAAARLVEIDSSPERSHVTLGIVQMNNDQYGLAEATLRAGMAKAGETAILLTNLAKVFDERGDNALAEQTLWRAVQADPNEEHGVMGWAVYGRERDGERGYLEALRTVDALPCSYRARFWLARHYLEQGELAAARALYEQLIAARLFDARALTMMSGDLGSNGHIAPIADLIGPVYEPREHDPMTGLNLLRAYLELGRMDEGEVLLARMVAVGNPAIAPYLNQAAQAFRQQRADA